MKFIIRLINALEGIHSELKIRNRIAKLQTTSVACPNGCRGNDEYKNILYCGIFHPCPVCGKKIEL